MSEKSNNYSYIAQHIMECFHIQTYVFDASLNMICPGESVSAENLHFIVKIITTSVSSTFPQILVLEDNVYFVLFPCRENYHMLLGPVMSNYLTTHQMNEFQKNYPFNSEKRRFPKLAVSQLMSLISMIWLMLTGDSIETHQIIIHKNNSLQLNESDSVEYHLYIHKEGKEPTNYAGEQIWCSYIESGDIQKMNEMISHTHNISSSFSNVGTLAKDNNYKQVEYTLVTSISLAMHAAIRGGVPPLNCYQTSDLLLQKAAVCSDILKLYDLFIECFRTFTLLVYQHNQEPQYGAIIEQCRDYIAKHLYHPFKIADMSAKLNINNNYLSQLFAKRTGMTIQHYIRDERLNAAANLLKYSEESIGQISDYMQFSSPSRFSSYFKEKFHMTPLEYRNRFKLAEFKE
ncbi:AraC family transcriptional regulator [Clostridium sp. AF19-22AC]|uniref:helix-turn-helix transcriptional regulator n=1 Tax=Clostridia TaxID=186801 RepID=UPI000E505C52|nr:MULTISPECIES: AraC family transcriptional regulator [Clostridia]RHR22571.1 AraC family transcriptional regulator [Clostridium sp. AF19-22AC]